MRELSNETALDISRTALDMVGAERLRQVAEKGYDYRHDDQHSGEELAAAAAFFLLPEHLNHDVCTSRDDYTLQVQPLHELIGANAWEGIFRDSYDDLAIGDAAAVDMRIDQLVKAVALGLAELERWMRARELSDVGEVS